MASLEKDMKHDHADIHAIHQEVSGDEGTLSHAYEAENREHEMGLWEAFQTYPWACFWAFLMCFTIVCRFRACHLNPLMMVCRSWSLSICSYAAAGLPLAPSNASTVS
jgi:hypothetical protein